ncbi:NifU family protein [Sulfurimonas sp. HSL1-2]|uniref:NifU family protein n=1 Tax=Thiomicrolovo zhangzhouensis TaxID=3131933 RepID=UPI0031F9D315
MKKYALDYFGFSNEEGDGCVAQFVDFPEIKGIGDSFEEAEEDAYERLEAYFQNQEEQKMTTFEAGVSAYEAKQYKEAYDLFVDSAANADANAMVNLGVMAMQGKGCGRDIEAAKSWFAKAAERGNMHAMMSLAQIHEKGIDGMPDAKGALQYYRAAADIGHVDAQFKAGMLLKEAGQKAEAMRYLITAAHNNNVRAQEVVTYVSNKELATLRNEPFRSLPVEKQITLVMQVIDQKIRPTLEADSGGIELLNYVPGETPQIWLNYLGACSGCHLGSTSTADMLLDAFEELIDKNVVLYLM